MKKKYLTFILIILSLFLVGCDGVIDLTDAENEYIAEYSAELLLKYNGFNEKYYNSDIITEEVTTEEATEDITSTEEVIEDVTTEDVTTEGIGGNDTTENSGGQQEMTPTFDAINYNIADLIDNKDFSVNYKEYHILQEYPSYDKDGVYLVIDAPEGYKLLVLNFTISNLTNEEKSLNLYEKDLNYKININGNKSASAMLTILLDDLYTYSGVISPGGTFDGVLLFHVSDEIANNINSMVLDVKYNEKQVSLIIK